MSQLKVFAAKNPHDALIDTTDGERITAELNQVGVLFERWATPGEIADDATQEELWESWLLWPLLHDSITD